MACSRISAEEVIEMVQNEDMDIGMNMELGGNDSESDDSIWDGVLECNDNSDDDAANLSCNDTSDTRSTGNICRISIIIYLYS